MSDQMETNEARLNRIGKNILEREKHFQSLPCLTSANFKQRGKYWRRRALRLGVGGLLVTILIADTLYTACLPKRMANKHMEKNRFVREVIPMILYHWR